jgi:hypothetical protein
MNIYLFKRNAIFIVLIRKEKDFKEKQSVKRKDKVRLKLE